MELEEISQKFEWVWTVWFHEVENSDYSSNSDVFGILRIFKEKQILSIKYKTKFELNS